MAKFVNVRLKDPNSVLTVGGARRTGATPFVIEYNEGTKRLIKGQILENLGEAKRSNSQNDSKNSENKSEEKENVKGEGKIKFD